MLDVSVLQTSFVIFKRWWWLRMLCSWRTNRTWPYTFSCSIWLMWCWRYYWGWIAYFNLIPIGTMLEIMLLNSEQVWWTAIPSVVEMFSSNMWPLMCSKGSPVNQSAFAAAKITLDVTWNYEVGPFPTKPCGDPSFTIPRNWSPNMQMFQHQVTTRASQM